jgi:hypothetical protein
MPTCNFCSRWVEGTKLGVDCDSCKAVYAQGLADGLRKREEEVKRLRVVLGFATEVVGVVMDNLTAIADTHPHRNLNVAEMRAVALRAHDRLKGVLEAIKYAVKEVGEQA